MNNSLGLLGLFIAALLGGAINAIAGGGSLVSFPSLVAYGVLTVPANATNTAALWPGSIGGAFGFWDEVRRERGLFLLLLAPSLVGGLLGAIVLVNTPESLFKRVVPFLVLFATLLFAGRDWFSRLTKSKSGPDEEHISLVGGVWGVLFQIAIATYGGYFGAGQSIMMMASLSVMGMRDLHRINGLKTALAVFVNGVALIFFALRGIIVWDLALIMGVGSIVGGYVAARISKQVNQRVLRILVVGIGLVVSAWLFVKP